MGGDRRCMVVLKDDTERCCTYMMMDIIAWKPGSCMSHDICPIYICYGKLVFMKQMLIVIVKLFSTMSIE